jgi:hypothetical protein
MERIRHLLDADTSESEIEQPAPRRRPTFPKRKGAVLMQRGARLKRLQQELGRRAGMIRKLLKSHAQERSDARATINDLRNRPANESRARPATTNRSVIAPLTRREPAAGGNAVAPPNRREPTNNAFAPMSLATPANDTPTAPNTEPREKIPTFEGFGTFPNGERLREFRDWMEKVNAAMSFAPHFTERQKYDRFIVYCGQSLSDIITTYGLKPPMESERPFSELIENIDAHFVVFFDPALDHQALLNCRQRADESAEAFYMRLTKLTRYRIVDENLIRSHFLTNLRDQEFANLAITSQWPIQVCVQAAARSEASNKFFGKNRERPEAHEVAAVTKKGGWKPRPEGQAGRSATKPPQRLDNNGNQCRDCGVFGPHRNGTCPAKVAGRTCSKCSKPGHFARMCRSAAPIRGPKRNSSVNQVMDEDWDVEIAQK